MTRRTSLKITDERERFLEEASEIVAGGPDDDPAMSDVLDAALTHLVQSEANIQAGRGGVRPEAVQRFNTNVAALRYRTCIESRWC